MASKSFTISASGFSTGLAGTIGYAIKSDTGSTLIARTTSGISETPAGSGCYVATVTGDDTWFGRIEWDASSEYAMTAFDWRSSGGSSLTVNEILDAVLSGHTSNGTVGKALSNVDALVSTRATPADVTGAIVAGVTIQTITPVDVDGNTTIVPGDDYVDGSANPSLTYTVTGYQGPSVSGATVTWRAVHMSKYARTGTSTADVTVTANTTVTADGTTLTIKVPVPAATSSLFTRTIPPDNDPNYKLTVTLTKGGKTLTEVIADLRVLKRIA